MFSVHALDFHGSVPNFRNRSGGGILLDIKPAFSEAGVYERLDSYGEEGRRIYSFRNARRLPHSKEPGYLCLREDSILELGDGHHGVIVTAWPRGS